MELPKTLEEFKRRYPKIDVSRCEEYVMQVVEYARTRPEAVQADFDKWVTYLNNYAGDRTKCCVLTKDFSPYSFDIAMKLADGSHWWSGGLIYYGSGETGVGGPQFSVRVGEGSSEGWSVHS